MAASPLDPWRESQATLGGSLSARPRGLVAVRFVLLDRDGREFGRMYGQGPGGARLDAGALQARIVPAGGRGRYTMLTGEAGTLAAQAAGSSVEIRCTKDNLYRATLDLLRNTAEAGPAGGGEETARLTGGLLRRGYDVVFEARDTCSLPIALFLLYYAATQRRRVFV